MGADGHHELTHRALRPRDDVGAVPARLARAFADRYGLPLDVRSDRYADLWLRTPDPRFPVPDLRHWYREPGLWLPLSCVVALVGGGLDQSDSLAGGAGCAVTFDVTGATLIVATVCANDGQTTPSDPTNGSYTAIAATALTNTVFSQMYYVVNGATGSLTISAANTNRATALIVGAFSGTHATAPLDTGAISAAFSNAIAPGSITPTEADSLVIATYHWTTAKTGSDIPTGYDLVDVSATAALIGGQAYGGSMAYDIQSGAGAATNPTWAPEGEGQQHCTAVAFKPAAGGGGGAVAGQLVNSLRLRTLVGGSLVN